MSKAHSLLRLTQKLTGTPQMMEAAYFDRVASILEERNEGVFEMALQNSAKSSERELIYNADTKTGIIELSGPLTYMHYEPMCGESPTSCQSLLADFEKMLDAGAKTIVLDTDSPGGEAYGIFETSRRIREMADKKGAKIIAYVDGMAASAAYAIASVADEIVMNPAAEVGSIGVVVRLRNSNKAMKKMGIEDTFVFAGKSKIPFDANGDFSEDFLNDLQEKVDAVYGEFISHVAQMRGMEKQSVIDTEAKTFLADKAIQLGLADKAMEVEEFYSYLSTVANMEKPQKMLLSNKFMSKTKQEESAKMQELVELQAAHDALTAHNTELEGKLSAAVEALAAKEAEVVSITEKLAQYENQIKAAAEAAEAARIEAEAQAAQAKLNARKERLEAAVAKEEVEALMASLGTLEDAAFETVASSLEKKAKAVQSSNFFQEMGVGDQGDEDTLSDTAKILTAKFKQS